MQYRIAKVIEAIEECNRLWESGQAASPSTSDYVFQTEKALGLDLPRDFREELADELHELASDGANVEGLAAFLYARVVVWKTRQLV